MRRALWSALALLLALSQSFAHASAHARVNVPMRWRLCETTDSPTLAFMYPDLYEVVQKKKIASCVYAKLKTATLAVLILEKAPARNFTEEELRAVLPRGYFLVMRSFHPGESGGSFLVAAPNDKSSGKEVYTLVQGVPIPSGSETYFLTVGIRGSRHTFISIEEIDGYLGFLLPRLLRPAR